MNSHITPGRLGLAAVLALALTACNSNDDDRPAATVAPPATDSFTAVVKAEAATSSDDTEPKDIDGIVLASSESAEPVAVD